MVYLDNAVYRSDIETAIGHVIGFENFYQKKVVIFGATGLIGSLITDCLIYANMVRNAGIVIYAVSRSIEQLKKRFGSEQTKYLNFMEADVTQIELEMKADYIIHAASYGHPSAFQEKPVEVLLSNVVGTQRVLALAKMNEGCRVLYVSSGEVQEQVDHLTVRACYPIGKKAAETLCISWLTEYGVEVVLARPCHTFGANMTKNDNRAAAQFLSSAAKGIHIQMYSAGEQLRSFAYVADCVSGLLTVLAAGEAGAVYGISSGECCTLRAFAEQCAVVGNCRVAIHTPTTAQQTEMSPIRKQLVDNSALIKLGWQPAFSIDEGIRRSIKIIREMGEL